MRQKIMMGCVLILGVMTLSTAHAKKLIAVLGIGFCWCYLTGEWQHDRKKAIKLKKHGRLSVSLFRYGLDYVQMAILRLIGFGKKEEFKKVLAILRKKKPDRTRVL